MPHISQMKKSNFLKKEDCGDRGILVTIKSVTEENVAADGAPEEYKWCLHLDECEKPAVLNGTNIQLIAAITGKQTTEEWVGHKIVLYNDPAVSYAGKITGGIRVRAPRGQAVKQPAQRGPDQSPSKVFQAPSKPAPESEPPQAEADDDVPF